MDRFEEFTTAILNLNRAILKIKTQEMKKYGLKPIHSICLYYIGKEKNGLNQAQLVKKCGEDKALISRSLNVLIKNEYINKLNDNKHFILTIKGKEISNEINEVINNVFNSISDLSDEERIIFYNILKRINSNIKLFFKTYKKDAKK